MRGAEHIMQFFLPPVGSPAGSRRVDRETTMR
jgi:hypothetical protein